MNKNTIIGTVLIVIIMVWWMSTTSKVPPQEPSKTISTEELTDSSLEIPALKEDHVLSLGAETPKTDSLLSDSLQDSTTIKKPTEQKDFIVETEKFKMVLTNQGAKVKSIAAKVLPDSIGNFAELISDTNIGALSLSLDKANLDNALFDTETKEDSLFVKDSLKLSFVFTDNKNRKVIREYFFEKDAPSVKQTNIVQGFSPKSYKISMNGGMRESESMPKGKSLGASYYFSEVIYNNTYGVERETITSKKTFNEDNGNLLWAGLRRKYVALTMQFENPTGAKIVAEPFDKKESEQDPGTYKISVSDKMASDSLTFNFMVLPLEWKTIEAFDLGYEKIIISGWQWCGADVWFVALCGFLLWLLKAFYSIIPNYGVAIILLTILVRLLTTPLTLKQLRSTREIAKFKPELDAINVKYRSDPQKRQMAIMEFYQKHKINPLSSCTGGCLPLLLQMPIFFGLFMILGRAIELRGQPFMLWISDLSRSDVLISGISIPYIMPQGIAILPLIMVVTTYFQTKQSMSAMTDPAQQKMMTWMMPAMMFFFSAVMPSGLVLYWIISNIWGIVQYRIMNPKTAPKKGKIIDAEIISKKK